MSTKIFKVKYGSIEKINGKKNEWFVEEKKVVAKNAQDAIDKAKKLCEKPTSFIDPDTKKKCVVTRSDYEALAVELLAETD